MSSQAGDDDEDLEPAAFILMRAEDTFDGQDRVMSRAAYDLQVRATAHSARCGHPGFVADGYLDGLATQTTITAVELCTVGMWERVDGGYRVLDSEAVQVCLDHVREICEDDAQAPAQGGGCHVNDAYHSAYLEDLAGRLYGLVIIFSDRLPADQVQWLHHVVEVGEYGLALEDLASMLAYDKIAVTDQERRDIVALTRQMRLDLGSSWPSPAEQP